MSQKGAADKAASKEPRKRSDVLILRPVDREMTRLVDDTRLGLMVPGRSAQISETAPLFRTRRSA